MKKFLCAILAVGMLLTGCGSDTQEQMQNTVSDAANQSVASLYDTVKALSSTDLVKIDDALISNYYGVDTSKLSEYVFAQAKEPTSAEIIIIAKPAAGVDLSIYKENFNHAIDQKKDEMTNYNEPDQVELLDNAVVEVNNKGICIVVSDKADAISTTILNSLGM